jgi:periplasmic protein TonB
MDRLQKKCVIASAATHLLLVALLFISPAFVTPEKPVNLPVLTFIPATLVDDPFSGGGTPTPPAPAPEPAKAEPQAPEPEPIAPAPKPVPKPEPEPAKPEPTRPAPPKRVEVKKPEKPAEPEPKKVAPPKRTIVPTFTKSSDDSKKQRQEEARQAEEARRQAAAEAVRQKLAQVQQRLAGLSTSTSIEPLGPGGAAYANYAQVVKSIYERAWIPPAELDDDLGSVKVELIIARSGRVVSAKIKRSSGNSALDRSVDRALQIREIPPFPEGTRDLQRVFIIDFNLKSKRYSG